MEIAYKQNHQLMSAYRARMARMNSRDPGAFNLVSAQLGTERERDRCLMLNNYWLFCLLTHILPSSVGAHVGFVIHC